MARCRVRAQKGRQLRRCPSRPLQIRFGRPLHSTVAPTQNADRTARPRDGQPSETISLSLKRAITRDDAKSKWRRKREGEIEEEERGREQLWRKWESRVEGKIDNEHNT